MKQNREYEEQCPKFQNGKKNTKKRSTSHWQQICTKKKHTKRRLKQQRNNAAAIKTATNAQTFRYFIVSFSDIYITVLLRWSPTIESACEDCALSTRDLWCTQALTFNGVIMIDDCVCVVGWLDGWLAECVEVVLCVSFCLFV